MKSNKTTKQKHIRISQNQQGDIIEKSQEMSENWIEKGFGKDIPKPDTKPESSESPKVKDNYREVREYLFN